jgi:hypothetical protein
VKRTVEPLDADGITNNYTGSCVENDFGQSNSFHSESFHRDSDLIKGCLPKCLSRRYRYQTDTLLTFEDLANLKGQGYPGKVLSLIVGVYSTKEELGAGGSILETEHGRRQYTLGDKSLERRTCTIDR